ncbi:MAG: phosphoglycerate kinase [Flavobacteriaceae bacterium]
MDKFNTIENLAPAGKHVLVRVDLNVPMDGDRVTDDTRLRAVAPTINELADKGAKVVLLAHFDRPKGKVVPEMSLLRVVPALSGVLGRDVAFAEDCVGEQASSASNAMKNGDVLLLDNTRFHPGEEKNDPAFAAELARGMDFYVNDAFSCAHRAHASTEGVAHLLPSAAGRSMQAELDALGAALTSPKRPVLAVVGGAKVSTKLDLLGNLSSKVDMIAIGGGMANTFLAALGHNVGKSLCEHDLLDTARKIVDEAATNNCEIVLPTDVVAAKAFAANAPHRICGLDEVAADEMILDIGAATVQSLTARLETVRTVVWNGPFGAFELEPFDAGTNAIANKVAAATKAGRMISVAGGGDTVAALNKAGAAGGFTYVSTAGGAFLEWLEGKTLPGVEALRIG